jgi:hypothetical protein
MAFIHDGDSTDYNGSNFLYQENPADFGFFYDFLSFPAKFRAFPMKLSGSPQE